MESASMNSINPSDRNQPKGKVRSRKRLPESKVPDLRCLN